MIHDISTTEFIAAVTDGSYNENDVQRYCNAQPSLMPLFKSLHKAASTLIGSKGIKGGYMWNLTEKRWDFDNSEDLCLYTDVEFVRLQSAMDIVCNLIEAGAFQERSTLQFTEEQQAAFDNAINAGFMEATESGYKWIYGGNRGKVRLAYFITQVFGNPIPYKALAAAFSVQRLDSAIQQALNMTTPKAKNKREWKKAIDDILR